MSLKSGSRKHYDRCCNPYKNEGQKSHKDKNLRVVSQAFRQKFPHYNKGTRICSACRHKYSKSFIINDVDEGILSSMIPNDDLLPIVDEPHILRSQREVELEDMLNGLKDKFETLNLNDPQGLSFLTVLPTKWSSRKIADEFNCSRRWLKNLKT